MPFEPEAIRVPCGHFIGVRAVPAADAVTVNRPSDAQPHACPPVTDAATVEAALRSAATRGIAAGTEWINRDGHSHDFAIPTGGYRQTLTGKCLGRQAVEAILRFKSVLIDFGAAPAAVGSAHGRHSMPSPATQTTASALPAPQIATSSPGMRAEISPHGNPSTSPRHR